jgi:class 3 adenylate cyclase
MPLPKVMPALADLTQDIAGPLPVDLLREWGAGRQDVETASSLLSDFRIEGTVVATDTAGLSQLTEERDLLDVLTLISAPKEIVHAVGTGVGGRAIGAWVADNTEMFYPPAIDAEIILAAAAETQARVAADNLVKIGMCIHRGIFYEIGGGLYGRDADAVESLAEHHARGGEVLITDGIRNAIADAVFHCEARPELAPYAGCGVFTLRSERRMPQLPASNTAYPHAFPPEFFGLLSGLRSSDRADQLKEQIYARYLHERAIVFLSMAREPSDGTLASLLDDLVTAALMDAVIRNNAGTEGHLAGAGGGLGILTFDTPQEALDFAVTIRARFVENAIPVKTGIDIGPVLLFQNAHGRSGITGEAVNVASKISEDAGDTGRINITARAAAQLSKLPPDSNHYQISVSGRTISGTFV